MARKPRIHIEGGVYHVMLRGNGGHDIFHDKDDYKQFYELIEEGVERYGHRIHAFCCMTNHVHLAVQVANTRLSKIIQNLSFRYTRHINKKHKRMGHLFQGRYKAILVDGDSYLLELVRYIHLNPVRAKITRTPNSYNWSSHRVYTGKKKLNWLTTDWILGQFSKQKNTAIKKYSEFVRAGTKEGYREAFHKGSSDNRILGEDSFIEDVLTTMGERDAPAPPLDKIIKIVCNEYNVKEIELKSFSRERNLSQARGIVSWLVVELKSATVTKLARYFNRDVSAISKSIRKTGNRKRESEEFNKKLDELNKSISQA